MPEEPVDELVEDTQAPDTAGAEDFPDPDLDSEPTSSDEPVSPAEAGESMLPEAPPLPPSPPTPVSPPADQGFTPYTPPRAEAPPAPAQPAVQFFSNAQLRQGVNEGLITEDQMVDQIQIQTRELAKQDALQAFQQQSRTQQVTEQLNEFRRLVPGWDQPGTAAYQQALPAYQRLLSLGQSANEITELLALEQTFGTAARIQEARTAQVRTAGLRDTPQEIGRRGPPPSSHGKKDPLDILSLEEKREYKKWIDKGVEGYRDWNDVRAIIRRSASQTRNAPLAAKHAGLKR